MKSMIAPLAALLVLVSAVELSAALTVFEGKDPGVGPGGLRPNSDAAAAAFDAAVTGAVTFNVIDFEGLAVDNSTFTGKVVAPGVTASLAGTDSGDPYNGISDWNTVIEGYNTTAGGSLHLGVGPSGVPTASGTFDFADPIDFLGAYITGLGTASGNLHVLFDDGAAQDLPVTGSPSGGVQFFGFTDDPGSGIVQVSFMLYNVSGVGDFFGLDDVRYGTMIPEPSTFIIWSLLATLGLTVGWWRRRRRAA